MKWRGEEREWVVGIVSLSSFHEAKYFVVLGVFVLSGMGLEHDT